MEVAVGVEAGLGAAASTDAHLTECFAPRVTLLAVADGFGEASASQALDGMRDFLRRRYRAEALARNGSPSRLRGLLLAALDEINGRLYLQSGSDDDYVRGGTSLTAIFVVGSAAIVGHVGDARAYLFRNDRLEPLTADDAMFADTAVTSTKSSLSSLPRSRGLLWRSLGTQAKLEASIAHIELGAGDTLVLCTDGVHRCLVDDDFVDVLESDRDAAGAVGRLMALVRERGNVDTATLMVGREVLAPTIARASQRTLRLRPFRIMLSAVTIIALIVLGVYAVVATAH